LGGVGRSAVQIARMLGARVAGSCSASGREEALALGVGERTYCNGSEANIRVPQAEEGRFGPLIA
jgi:NADPH:quinone reductase-like Zn-dependent oxidoreductase